MQVQFASSPALGAAPVNSATASGAGVSSAATTNDSFMSFESVLNSSMPDSDTAGEPTKPAAKKKTTTTGDSDSEPKDCDSSQDGDAVPAAVPLTPEPQPEQTTGNTSAEMQLPLAVDATAMAAIALQAALAGGTSQPEPAADAPAPADTPQTSSQAGIASSTANATPAEGVPVAAKPDAELAFAARLMEPAPKNKGAAEAAAAKRTVAGDRTEPAASEKAPAKEIATRAQNVEAATNRADASLWTAASASNPRTESVRTYSPPTAPTQAAQAASVSLDSKADFDTARGPVREITLNLNEPGQGRTELRLMDKDGVVGVAVRTSDSELAATLRGNLNELTRRLESVGYSAETWNPQTAQEPLRAAQTRSQFSEQQKQSGQEDTGRRQGGGDGEPRQNRQQPQWMDEFESIMGAIRA